MRVAPPVELTDGQRQTLQQWARGRSLPARQVERARVVLLAADGKQDLEIAAEIGISNQKAARWRKRFLKLGLVGLEKDALRASDLVPLAIKISSRRSRPVAQPILTSFSRLPYSRIITRWEAFRLATSDCLSLSMRL
jgi:Homeodomain-like domain